MSHPGEDDEKRKRHKQMKKMSRVLSTIWGLSDPVFQDGPSGEMTLTHIGEQLDSGTVYCTGNKQGWIHLAQDIRKVYAQHAERYVRFFPHF
jgi:hypothetical protein